MTDWAQQPSSEHSRAKTFRQRGAFYIIALIPLSLLFLSVYGWWWGACAAGAVLAIAGAKLRALSVSERRHPQHHRFGLLGTPIDRVTFDEALEKIEQAIASGQRALVCTPDTTAIWRAQRDRALREVYERASLVTPDGTGVVWAARLLGVPLRERVSGIDLLEKLFARGKALKIFLLGAAPGIAERAAQRLSERYSDLQIVGTHHGYFEKDNHIVELVRRARPDILLVGLGVPRQELWMLEHRAELDVAVMIGVGGCFDVWAGRLSRAPQRLRRWGLEWAYRVCQEPRRLARVSAIPLFIAQVSLIRVARVLGVDSFARL